MARYKQLISEKNFLKVRARARALLRNGSDLVAILYNNKRLIFKTASGTYGKKVIWTQEVEITDALIENILSAKTFNDVETLIKESNLKVNCDCYAYLFWGFKYKAWHQGYGLERENRRPIVRNPHQKGYVCFVEGTPVVTQTGYKDISKIKVGDKVVSHKGNICTVIATSSHIVSEVVCITYDDKVITSTPNHPYLVFQNGRTFWRKAEHLRKGDTLVAPLSKFNTVQVDGLSVGLKTISVVHRYKETHRVYNIEVSKDHTFIVEDVAVHNCKHLYLVLSLYPFWAKALAAKFRNWAISKEGAQVNQNKRFDAPIRNKKVEEQYESPDDEFTEEELETEV